MSDFSRVSGGITASLPWLLHRNPCLITQVRKQGVYDQGWIEAEMVGCYDDVTMIPELAKGAVTLLTSSKTDEELQNEVGGGRGELCDAS